MNKSLFLSFWLSILALECIIFFGFYWYGANGYPKITQLRESLTALENHCTQTKAEVVDLEKQIHNIKTYPYHKEKIIREQLQMLNPNEVIYKKN